MKHRLSCAIALCSALAIGQAVAAPIVTNGGFESGLTGWTLSDPDGYIFTCGPNPNPCTNPAGFQQTGAPHSGGVAVVMGDFSPRTLSQALSTISGERYDISFWMANCPDRAECKPNGMKVEFGGQTLLPSQAFDSFGWTQFVFSNILATSNSSTLSFSGYNTPAFFMLDDISVAQAALPSVPEPGTLMLVGLAGALGLAGGRRRPNS